MAVAVAATPSALHARHDAFTVGVIHERSPLEHIYAYDLVKRVERSAEFSIDAAEFERQDWGSVGLSPTEGDALREHFKGALEVFVEYYRRRFAANGA